MNEPLFMCNDSKRSEDHSRGPAVRARGQFQESALDHLRLTREPRSFIAIGTPFLRLEDKKTCKESARFQVSRGRGQGARVGGQGSAGQVYLAGQVYPVVRFQI